MRAVRVQNVTEVKLKLSKLLKGITCNKGAPQSWGLDSLSQVITLGRWPLGTTVVFLVGFFFCREDMCNGVGHLQREGCVCSCGHLPEVNKVSIVILMWGLDQML